MLTPEQELRIMKGFLQGIEKENGKTIDVPQALVDNLRSKIAEVENEEITN